jgi:hypothetical protein
MDGISYLPGGRNRDLAPSWPHRVRRTSQRRQTVAHPAVEALFAEAERLNIPFSHVMRRAGVCDKSHWSWRFEYLPNTGDLEAALNVVGLTLRAVPLESGQP